MEKRSGISKLAIGLVLIVAGIGLLIWILSNRGSQEPANTTTNTSETAQEENTQTPAADSESENTATIAFTNTGFTPDSLSVRKGTVITVRNESDTNVQFSSNEHPSHRDNNEMNLKTLAPGESASFTATKVGEWGFHDHIDESKTGTITVTE